MSFDRTNLCTNPRAAVDTAGWVVEATSGTLDFSLARSTDWGMEDDGTSFLATGTSPDSGASIACGIITPTPVLSNGFASVVGEQYTIGSYVKTVDPSVNRGYFQRILWYDAGGSFISTSTGSEVADEGADGLRLVDTFTAPAGAARGRPNVRLFTNSADDVLSFHVSRILVEQAAAAASYFDGDSPGADWTGTPHDSTSILSIPLRVRRGGQWVDALRRVRRDGEWVLADAS